MKIMRYILVMAVALLGILVFVNVPELAEAMLKTVAAVSWQDWFKYVIGIVIGTVATFFAMRSKNNVEEDNSNDN